MTAPTRNKHVKYFRETLESCLEGAEKQEKAQILLWLSNNHANRAHNYLKAEQKVFTIMSRDKAVQINHFYYVPSLNSDVEKKVVSPLDLLAPGQKAILIRGRLGQGKSMLLRYLGFLELNLSRSIPIFIELRNVPSSNLILESVAKKLCEVGLESTESLAKYLFERGKLTLLLDGFDELEFSQRKFFNEAISKLKGMSLSTRLIVTSRNNTEISTNVHLSSYSVSLLKQEDLNEVILKILMGDEEEYLPIFSKMEKTVGFDYDILDTPLLVTWFVMVYKMRRKIPRHKIGFYQELFNTIMSRHDGLKGSYDRPSKSKLSDDEIRSVLECVCYLSRKEDISTFSGVQINEFIRRSLNICKFEDVKVSDYLYDLTHVTCLIVEEKYEFNFIHRSVQYYFSSCFVQNATESQGNLFYEKRVSDWMFWEEELQFLAILDSYRYISFFMLPTFKLVLDDENNILDGLVKSQRRLVQIVLVDREGEMEYLFCLKSRSEFFTVNQVSMHDLKNDFIGDDFTTRYVEKNLVETGKLSVRESLEPIGQHNKFEFYYLSDVLSEAKLIDNYDQLWVDQFESDVGQLKANALEDLKNLVDREVLF